MQQQNNNIIIPRNLEKMEPRHKKQDSLMGSVCEFSDNQEYTNKIPPKMQMQASKLQSPPSRTHKINQQFLAINKDTGEIFDLRNPESASQLIQYTIKAEHLQKNKLPWEEWWKQKKQNNIEFLAACQQNDFNRCSDLLSDSKGDLKAETNFCDQQTGWSPLHFACLNNNINLVNKLIINEANVNQETVNQVTPLMITVEQGLEEIMIFLLKVGQAYLDEYNVQNVFIKYIGAEINIQDENGNTVLHIAYILLNKFKPDISIKNKKGKLCFDLAKTTQAMKYFEDFKNKVQSPIFKTKSSNKINLAQVNPSNNSKINLQTTEEASNSMVFQNNTKGTIIQTNANEQKENFKQTPTQLIDNQKYIQNEDTNLSNSSLLYPNNKQDNMNYSQKQDKSSKQNIKIEVIQQKKLSISQLPKNKDFLSPMPKSQQENKNKNTNQKLSQQQATVNSQLKQLKSKNGTPRSRDQSINESFFNRKGYFSKGKDINLKENALQKKGKQITRHFSINNPSLSNMPTSDVYSTTNTTAINTLANISQIGSGSSKNNSIQSIEAIQPQITKLVQPSQNKITIHSFIIHSMLGKGSFGDVYLVQKKDNLQFFAMKVLQKNKMMKSNVIKYALTERNVLSITNHPFIVKLNYSFQTDEKLFLILDFAAAGDMGKLLQKVKVLNENHARIYLCEILLALEDLHKRDIIFRDLKPDNIVIDDEGHALLTDFGLSKEGVLDYTAGAKSFCGSVAYLAPEMLKRRGHGKAVDWYLFGVLMYEMLTGSTPYFANNKESLFQNIQSAPLQLPQSLSQEAKSLLIALLERNPEMRLGCGRNDANDIKNHPFFKNVDWNQVYERKVRPPDVQLLKLQLNNYNSDQFIESLIGNNIDINNEKHISGWSFIAGEQNKQMDLIN